MKKKVLLIGMSALLLCGCGKIPKLANGEEAVVTMKDEAKISVNQLYDEIKDSYGLQTLINMIDKHIYETEFSSKMKDAEAYAKAMVSQFKANYDEAKALQILSAYYGYSTFDAYQNAVYMQYLQSEAIEEYVKGLITDDELKNYYENNVYPNMTISHILITPDVSDKASDEEKTEAENKAKDTAKEVINKLNEAKKAGKNINEEFGNLAKEYSEDAATKNKNGDLGEINLGSLDSKYDELVKTAAKLNDGEYSTEVITTELGYHVILKTKTGEKESYDNSIISMKEKIASEKLTASDSQSLKVDAIKSYRDKYELNIIDSELSTQYGKYMNNLINQAKANK